MKQILGIDIGGTKIAAGLVDKNYRVEKLVVHATSQTDLLGQLEKIITEYSGYSGIGVGFPGRVLPSGVVRRILSPPFVKSVNLKKILENRFQVPVTIENDARAFTLSEAYLGSGKKYQSVFGLILGTGIGSGMALDHRLYYGANHLAGILGHVHDLDGSDFEKKVKQHGKFKNAKESEKYLRFILDIIVCSLDPEIIVVGGGWSNLPGMQQVINRLLKPMHNPPVKTVVKISKLKHAGIIGAAIPLLRR